MAPPEDDPTQADLREIHSFGQIYYLRDLPDEHTIASQPHERGASMFASPTAKVVTAVCAVVGAIALLGNFYLTLTGGSPYLQFALAVLFFAMFLVGSYWWMIFGPGRSL